MSRRISWVEHVARMGKRIMYRLLVEKPEGRKEEKNVGG
jgi:hypothetical protein